MVTEKLSVVKGRLANFVQMQGKTVFLRQSNNIVQVYPVSSPTTDNAIKTVVPFMLAYALTIPKAQGQTLDNCVVWLDSPLVAPGVPMSLFLDEKISKTYAS